MVVDYIIIGQGLCGSWLSYFLMERGARVVVVHKGTGGSASDAASGVINPITGKRLARQWMGATMLPFAAMAYEAMGQEVGIRLAREVSIDTYFSNGEEASFFEVKASSQHDDVLSYSGRGNDALFNYHYGVGTIRPALLVDVRAMLGAWRAVLRERGALLEMEWDWEQLEIAAAGVQYGAMQAKAVIDCSGARGAGNRYFERLPFALNKGEAIIADIPELGADRIYKYAHLSIVPWEDGKYWVGSTFDWDYKDELPTAAFMEKAEGILKQWLRVPFTLGEHFAAIRPATVTRDAFVGLHTAYPGIGILNGMGSKGCSLAPFLADNLAGHLVDGMPLNANVDVARYRRVLGG